MIRKITFSSSLILSSFLFISLLVCFSLNAQNQSFATVIVNQDNVDNANLAVNENLSDFAEIKANSGTLIVGAYDGVLEIAYNQLLPANTTSYIKIETEDDLLPSLLGGSLGELLSDVLGSVLIGNQEFTVTAKNATVEVLSATSSDPNSFSGERVKVIKNSQGDFYIAITPNASYSSLEITNHIGTLLGLNEERTLRVFGVYYGSNSPICNSPTFTSYDGSGLNLDLINLGGAGVSNIENAIDNDISSFSELSLGIIAVTASIQQEIYFENAIQTIEDIKIRLAIDPSLFALGVANNIEFEAFDGSNLVATKNLSSLLNLELINLLQNNQAIDIGFEVTAPADRLVIRYSSLLNTSVSQRLDIYDVAISFDIPIIDIASQNLELCAGQTASLIASSSPNTQIKWYDQAEGGNLLSTVNSGDPFTTPILTETTTYYCSSITSGCLTESARTSVLVSINPSPTANDIVVLGFDSSICIPEILNITPSSTISNVFKFYLDENKDIEITDGLINNGLLYTISVDSELYITGLTEFNNPNNIYISAIDALTNCENAPGNLKNVNIVLDNAPNVSLTISENITFDDIINSVEANGNIIVSGNVSGDAQEGDVVTLTINNIEYNTSIDTSLNFSLSIAGSELVLDSDTTIEAEITINGDFCSSTAMDEESYSVDITAPTIPTIIAQTTNDTTPIISGTADSQDELTLTVNGVTYTEGDGNLVDNGDDTFTLQIPDENELPENTYDVVASAIDSTGNTANDATVDELIITIGAPTTDDDEQEFCATEEPTVMDIQVNESNVNWYLTMNGGTALPIDTALENNTTYYGAQVSNSTESSERLAILITIINAPTPTTTAASQSFCVSQNPTVADIIVNETTINWYNESNGGTPIPINTPLNNGSYYASLTLNGCESNIRLEVEIIIEEYFSTDIISSENVTCFDREVTYSTESGFNTYLWDVSSGGTIISGGSNVDHSVTVIWNELGAQSVSLNFDTESECSSGESTLLVDVLSCSDLAITKEVDNLTPNFNSQITYVISVSNNGNTVKGNIEIDEVLPSGLVYVSHTTDSGGYNENDGKWNIPIIQPNTTVYLEITTEVLEYGNYLNIATIIDSSPTDIDLSNNSAEVEITPNCLKVYNEFSPNGDGLNDHFTIRCIEQFPGNKLIIYNRAGIMVFETVNYDNSWNGEAKKGGVLNQNTTLPSSTYYYVLDLNNENQPITGWLYIAK